MNIVPLTEPLFLATVPVSFGRGWKVWVYERGTYDPETGVGMPTTVYDSEAATEELAQPLTTDRSGRPRGAGETLGWVEGASYDLAYSNPERPGDPPVVVPWEAAKGGGGPLPSASAGVIFHGSDADTPRGTELAHYIWVGSVEPSNMDPDADLFVNTNGLSAEDIEGLGDAAGLDVGTTAGTVAAGDDTRITGAQQKSEKGAANGYAELEAAGKVPVSQLPSAIMEYQGTWNASTNSPKLEDGKGSAGDVYRVSVAGERNLGSGSISFAVGDYAVYNGSTWEKSDTTDSVASVAGKTGVVKLSFNDIEGLVSEAEIAEEAVSTSRLKALAVTAVKIAEGAITAAKLAGEAVGTAALAALAVTTAKIAEGAVTAAKLAEKAVTAAKIGDLGQGTVFAPGNYTTGLNNVVPGAKAMFWVPVKIPQTVTLTGVSYEVGTTSNGKVIGALYNSKGERLAKSTGTAQSSAEFFQRLAFEATVEVTPGVYWIGLILESGTGTFSGGYQMSPWLKATQAEFTTPATFAPPTELNNTGARCPFVATF
jgi:hypothetical protein